IKGGVITPADLATGNIGVVSDGAGTLNIRLAKALSGLTLHPSLLLVAILLLLMVMV
ncbi:MAG: hypothetical protein HXP26_07575, partial [Veillonella tobetsuensis]|nr:hypothetical protein [Veillonella tobetsuensis]